MPNTRNSKIKPEDTKEELVPENLFQFFFNLFWRKQSLSIRCIMLTILLLGIVWISLPDTIKVKVFDSISNYILLVDPEYYYPPVSFDSVVHNINLSEWTPASDRADKNQHYKVTWETIFIARKLQKTVSVVPHRTGTTGEKPEYTSSTHKYKLVKTQKRPGDVIDEQWTVMFIVPNEIPVHKPFEIRLKTIRMGSFTDKKREWANISIEHPTEKVEVKITFPDWKPAQHFDFMIRSLAPNANSVDLQGADSYFFQRNDKVYCHWILKHPRLGFAYKIYWDW